MELKDMIGYKLFKENEDSIHMVRIMKVKTLGKADEVTILDYSDNETKTVKVASLSEYSPLKPDGIMLASIVGIRDDENKMRKDVIISVAKYLNIEYKLNVMPYAVCRQSINDVIYDGMTNTENELVGLALNQDSCPRGFDFGLMFAADTIDYSQFVSFYRTDTLEDIYTLLNMKKYNEVLSMLYKAHVNAVNKPEYMFKKECDGWCKDLPTLLSLNNFQSDINDMLGIIQVDFCIKDFTKEESLPSDPSIKYLVGDDDFKQWLSYTYRQNINTTSIVEFDHDINLADYNNASYILLRDSDNILYFIVYTTDGEYLEADLAEEEKKKNSFMERFKLSFNTDKYSK